MSFDLFVLSLNDVYDSCSFLQIYVFGMCLTLFDLTYIHVFIAYHLSYKYIRLQYIFFPIFFFFHGSDLFRTGAGRRLFLERGRAPGPSRQLHSLKAVILIITIYYCSLNRVIDAIESFCFDIFLPFCSRDIS